MRQKTFVLSLLIWAICQEKQYQKQLQKVLNYKYRAYIRVEKSDVLSGDVFNLKELVQVKCLDLLERNFA